MKKQYRRKQKKKIESTLQTSSNDVRLTVSSEIEAIGALRLSHHVTYFS